MENIIDNIFVDENTEQYYKLRKSFEEYIYFECVVKSCTNKLNLSRATQNKITKNEHNHTKKEGQDAAARNGTLRQQRVSRKQGKARWISWNFACLRQSPEYFYVTFDLRMFLGLAMWVNGFRQNETMICPNWA